MEKITLDFQNEFIGRLVSDKAELLIGNQEGGLKPYNLLFAALASCFYATFLSIVQKKRLSFSGARLEVDGRKRQEVPTTLEYVMLKLIIQGAQDKKKGFIKSAELASEYCSIYQTVGKVAQMNFEVEFID